MDSRDYELREREQSFKESEAQRDYELRLREQEFKEREATRSRITNPLVIVVVGGLIAAFASSYSARITSENQQNVERNKLSQERQLAIQTSEESRIHEAMKLTGCDQVKGRLAALERLGLISDVNRMERVKQYSDTLTCEHSPPPQLPLQPLPPFELGSDWLGGGHNQVELCQALRPQAVERYPSRPIVQVSSREESKKDWLGRVEYRYFCTFQPQ